MTVKPSFSVTVGFLFVLRFCRPAEELSSICLRPPSLDLHLYLLWIDKH